MLRKLSPLVLVALVVLGDSSFSTLTPQARAAESSGQVAAAANQSAPQGNLSTLADSGSAAAGAASVEPQTVVFDDVVPLDLAEALGEQMRADQRAAQAGKPRPFVPVPLGAFAQSSVMTDTPPTIAGGSPDEPAAAMDMTYFVNHDISAAEVPTSQRSTVMEPTAINLGNTIFYTANWYAARSSDGGNTFTYINPYTMFPNVNGGFCCDQVTAYAPGQDMAIWGLQYVDDGTTNTLRIARAIGAAGVNANTWIYYDFTPQMVGFASGVWFDYPSMTVAGSSLYVSSNAFLTSNNSFAGNVVMRIPLAQLAAGTSLTFSYFRSNIGTERFTEGAGSTIYWAAFASTSQMRISRWAEGSGTIFWDTINLNAFNWLSRDGLAPGPDGTNWALRADGRPTAAYVAGGVIGVMWTAKQGGSRPKPYTVHARFSEATRALISQADIWNSNYAWMYPAVGVNSVGALAGTLQIGGDASGIFAYPGTQIWITDDVTGASNTVGALYYLSSSNDGPNNNAWGDFFSVRPHKSQTKTWVAASHTLQGGGNGVNTVPNYLWFGRQRDNTVKATMISPAGGSTLAGSSVTFNWTDGNGASQFWLYVGNAGVGSTNIYNQNAGTDTSRTVSGLPSNGSTVYVRLWTLMGTDWEYNDYTYTAATGVKAAITSPSPGSTLGGATATFSWTTGTGALGYWLYVGTAGVGSQNILDESQGMSTSRVVSGLPTAGGTIYVRLWTLLSSGWQFTDYTYTAATVTCVAATMTSPAAASTLPGSSVPFVWTPGVNNSKFWLYVGTTAGGTQIYNQDQGALLTRTVTGVPTNGATIYARLWSLCSAWTFTDYTYTAANVPLTARLTSPANRSVLPGASATFNWSAGSASTQYWIFLGSTRGGSDIFNEDQGAALTRTVSGLPVDGRRVYLRLWSFGSGVWTFIDYEFTAAGTARALLTSPAEGSVLTASPVQFNWSAGTSSSQYWIDLGTTLGGTEFLTQNMLAATTASVSTVLPADRSPIYLRLWSKIGAVWVSNDYRFRAYDGGPSKGHVTSPTPESIVSGPSMTLSWSAGAGATQYWVYAGTTPGGTNLLNLDMGTALTVVVNGLPANGNPIYIRLYSRVGGVWTYDDYEYTSVP